MGLVPPQHSEKFGWVKICNDNYDLESYKRLEDCRVDHALILYHLLIDMRHAVGWQAHFSIAP